MTHIELEMNDQAARSLGSSPLEVGRELRLAAAVKLFEMGRVSSGAAAEIAGIPKPLFLMRLADYGVPTFDMSAEDFARETLLGQVTSSL